MKNKCKCYAVPKGYIFDGIKICDGRKSNSTKCPYRHKARDGRHKLKAETRKEIEKLELIENE